MDLILIDDNPDLIEQASIYLQREDERFNIHTTTSPINAFNKIKDQDFDVVVSDYQMPEMTGLDLLKKMRDNGYNTPFIIFTGRGREEVAIKALNLGADRYIQKGCDIKTQYSLLANNIKQVVDLEESKQRIKEKKNKIKALHKIGFQLNKTDNEEDILDLTIKAASDILEFNVCDIDFLKDGEFIPKRTTREDGIPVESYPFKGTLAKTYKTKESFITNDITNSDTADPIDKNYKSGISVPIGDYGVFQAISFQKDYFDEEDLELSEILISHVNLALNKVKFDKKRQKEKDKIEKLHKITSKMENVDEMKDVFDLAIEAVENILDFNVCSFSLADDDEFVITAKSSAEYLPIGYRFPINTGIAGKCYKTGSKIVTKDVDRDNRAQPNKDSYKSGITLPILNIGIFQIIFDEKEAFDDHDVRVVELLINHVNEALKRIRSTSSLKESEATYKTIYENTLKLSKEKDFDKVIKTIADNAKKLLKANDSIIYLLNTNKNSIEPIYSNNPDYKEEIMNYDISLGEGLTGNVVKNGEAKIINYDDEKNGILVIPGTEKKKDHEHESVISTPLFIDDKVQGAITVTKFKEKFSEEDIIKLNTFARQAEIAIKRAEELDNLKRSKRKLKENKNKIEELHYAVNRIEKSKNEQEIYHLAIKIAENILDFDIAEFMVKSKDELVVKAKSYSDPTEDDRIGIEEGIAGRTYKHGSSYIIGDIPNYFKSEPTNEDYKSGISVPVGKYGVFQAISTEKDNFDQNDLDLAEILISHVTEKLKNISNEKKIKRESEKIERLHKFAANLESCLEKERVFELITEAGENILDLDICKTYISKDDDLLIKKHSSMYTQSSRSLAKKLADKTYDEDKILTENDIENIESTENFKSIISMPIASYGVFQAISKDKKAFDQEDTKLSKLLIDHAVEALNRIQSESREEFLLTLLRHDLKNKNNITRGYISIIQDMDIDDKQKTFLEKASTSCEESMSLIKKVGMLRKIDKEKEKKEINIHHSLNQALDNLYKIAEEKNIKIDYEKCSNKVSAGPLLKEAFSNIIENCLEHSDGSHIKIYSNDYDRSIELIIEDDGKGISDDKLNKVFKRGFKGRNSGGLGIGMYIVKSIIDNYDGNINLGKSELGGARFEITLNKT